MQVNAGIVIFETCLPMYLGLSPSYLVHMFPIEFMGSSHITMYLRELNLP